MKKITVVIFLLTLYSFAQAQDMKSMDMNKKEAKQPATTYTCPMHPEIHSAKPGKCPKCGMTLVKEKLKPMRKQPVKMQTSDTSMNGMNMQADSSMHNHDMHNMQMNDSSMNGMNMQGDSAMSNHDMNNMQGMNMDDMQMNNMPDYSKAAKDLGMIKYKESSLPPHTVHYDLYVTDTTVTFGKKQKRAIAVNGQIPMPTLTFTEGDTAEIVVHNEMDEPTSLHWHGLFLPNKEDGVAYLTQMPIPAHSIHTYRFPIVQSGTHWYHSHFELQEQIGMYGMFIMNKRKEWDIPTVPVIISEWTDMKPEQVNRHLHAASDWFSIQKGSTQSYSESIKTGNFGTKLANEWKRMNAMDLSDIYYDNFLLNGKNQTELSEFKAGDKVRLRIANGGASDYFWLSYAGGKITVVATDGNDVKPVEVDRLIIATSETYDVVVTIPENKSYEFLVTPEDRTSHASIWLGSGEKVSAVKLQRPKYFAGMKMMNNMMKMDGNMMQMPGMKMQNQVMDMNTVMYPEITGTSPGEKNKTNEHDMHTMNMSNTGKMKMADMQGMNMSNDNVGIVTLNYAMLRAPEKTTLPAGPIKELKFDLTGNMNRYVWSMDNKTISESDKILVKKGENLRIILYNNSMMRHPMHLHGHDFRLLNGQGEYAPMKNIIDIMPMERDTIEFAASEPYGDWFFHCHILYHMMGGMGRVVHYDTAVSNPYIPDPKLAQRKFNADDRMFHLMAKVGVETNGSDGQVMLANTRWQASTMWHLGYHDMHGYESETMFGRYLGRMQWWYPYVGFDYHYQKEEGESAKNIFDMSGSQKNIFGSDHKNMFGQTSNKNNRHTVVAGIAYTLPTLTVADFRVDGNGKFRFQLSREDLVVTPRLRFNWMINTDKEYALGLRYIATKYISISSHYDSDMGIGAGITFTY